MIPSTICVEDCGVDAALVDVDGEVGLILRPGQTFGSAVNAVSAVLPYETADTVRAIVRENLPDAIRLDDLLQPAPTISAVVAQEDVEFLPRFVWVWFAVAGMLLLAGFVSVQTSDLADVRDFQEYRKNIAQQIRDDVRDDVREHVRERVVGNRPPPSEPVVVLRRK